MLRFMLRSVRKKPQASGSSLLTASRFGEVEQLVRITARQVDGDGLVVRAGGEELSRLGAVEAATAQDEQPAARGAGQRNGVIEMSCGA